MAKFDIGKWRATVDLGASASASICGALFFLEARVVGGDAKSRRVGVIGRGKPGLAPLDRTQVSIAANQSPVGKARVSGVIATLHDPLGDGRVEILWRRHPPSNTSRPSWPGRVQQRGGTSCRQSSRRERGHWTVLICSLRLRSLSLLSDRY